MFEGVFKSRIPNEVGDFDSAVIYKTNSSGYKGTNRSLISQKFANQ